MNFKKTLLASLLMISASGAFAAETATLSVKGTIAPSACTVELNGTSSAEVVFDVADYVGAQMTLDPQTIPFSITCNPNAAMVTFVPVDNSPGHNGRFNNYFHLGRVGGDASPFIGTFTVRMDNLTTDSRASRMLQRSEIITDWQVGSDLLSEETTHTFGRMGALEPQAARNFSADMIITPTIDAGLPANEAIELQGSVAITITQI